MADEDQALFDSALSDAPETPAEPAPQPRDESGRFAAKQAEVVEQPKTPETHPVVTPEPTQEPQPQMQGIPPWRLKEEADARRALEAEVAEMRRELAQARQPKQPDPVPDLYENPTAFVDHGVKQHVDPIRSEIANLREHYSRQEAIRQHGQEKVAAAYQALDAALRSRDPEASMVYHRAKESIDPFGDIMNWHTKRSLFEQVGSDPNAWFEKQLEERMKDQAFSGKILERIRGNVQQAGRPPVTQLPPSLNKATSAADPGDDGEDEGEAGLLKSALRR